MSTIPKEIQKKMNKSINALGYELPAEVWDSVYDIWNEYKLAVELATDELEKENEYHKGLYEQSLLDINNLEEHNAELQSENEALKSCVKEHDKELQEAFKEGQNSIGHAGHW